MKAYHGSAVLKFDDTVTGNAGVSVPVTVRVNSNQSLAVLFDLDDSPVANPVTTDNNGNYSFKASDNIYDINISEGTGSEVKLQKVEIAEIPTMPILINDLSQAYEFKTVLLLASQAVEFPEGKILHLLDRDATFEFHVGGTSNGFDILDAGNGNTAELITTGGVNVIHLGATSANDLAVYITAGQAAGHSVILVPELEGGASYNVSSSYLTTAPIIIDLTGAKINVTHNDDFIRLSASNSVVIGGTLTGTGKGDLTRPLQSGIRVMPNTHLCTLQDQTMTGFAGDITAGAIVLSDQTGAGVLPYTGHKVINPTLCKNNVALNLGERNEYSNIIGGQISDSNNIAIRWRGGNNTMTGTNVSNNVIGVDLVNGDNDGHGSVNNCQINHNDVPIRIGALQVDNFEFNNNHIFFGVIELNGCKGVLFTGGEVGNISVREDGCTNCYFVGTRIAAGGMGTQPNFNGNASEVFYLDLIQAPTVTGTSSRINGLRSKASNNVNVDVLTGENIYIFPLSENAIPFNLAYTVQEVYDVATGNFNAKTAEVRGGFEIPIDVRLTVATIGAWDPTTVQMYIKNIDTGAIIANLVQGRLTSSGGSDYYTFQFSGVVEKVNMALYTVNGSGVNLSTNTNQENWIRNYWLSTIQ